MSEKARKFRKDWVLNPSKEIVLPEEIMQAYADKCVAEQRKRIVDALEKERLRWSKMKEHPYNDGMEEGIGGAIFIIKNLKQ